MVEFKMAAIIQLGDRMNESEDWISLSQVWVAWTNLSEVWVTRVFEIQMAKMAESKMAEFKMAAIIKLSENEWVKN